MALVIFLMLETASMRVRTVRGNKSITAALPVSAFSLDAKPFCRVLVSSLIRCSLPILPLNAI